jgi:alpha-beta hydrolase superfamily lysophospholipase
VQLELLEQKPSVVARPHPILFVHGMWHAAWCWEETFLPYFAQQGYPAFAVSLRGHGNSAGHERLRWSSLSQYVSDVAQAVRETQSHPVVVGHSMGGVVVQKYIQKYEAPAAVLLASVPPGRGAWGATWRVFRRHPLSVLKVILTMRLYPVVSTPSLAAEFLFSSDMPLKRVEAYHARLQDDSYRAYLDLLGLGLPRRVRPKMPLLLLGAGDDRVITPSDVRATARAYGTSAEIFPGMAHDMMLEKGWQAVADRIIAWLADQGY